MRQLIFITPLIALTALTACTKDSSEETGETGTEAVAWVDMDFSQRQAYMASEVMPPMQEAFASYDPESYETITCGTCHGEGAEDGSFSMPAEHLYAIDFADFPTGEGADFMAEEVVPKMTELLGAEPYDPATGEGFGCVSCHPVAE